MNKKILVVSSTPWNTNYSIGNSYANIFDNLGEVEIANLYCMDGIVNDPVVKCAYRISEKTIIQKLLRRSKTAGEEVPVIETQGTGETLTKNEKMFLNFAKKARWQVLFWAREFLWKIGGWNEPSLEKFVRDFSPDLIFIPIYGKVHMCRVDLAVKKMAGVPMLGYNLDDFYTLHNVKFSPLWWIDRLYSRRLVKKVIDACDQLYVISENQKWEYDKIFDKDCHILTKGGDFTKQLHEIKRPGSPIRLLFAGNIGDNRWKSLAILAQTIRTMNQNGPKLELTIYTATPLTRKMEKALNIPNCSTVAGRIPYCEVSKRQQEADILVHVEATDLRYRWASRHSFSTKLVDYMLANRPILAYGLEDQASIFHLKKHDAALVATNPTELHAILERIVENPQILQEYATKAWKCGENYHDIHRFHEMLRKDFEQVLYENCTN